jgi:hypothetical protein
MHWDRLTLAELSFVTLLQVSWNGMGDYTSPAASGNDAGGSVDSWVPFSITDAHNCGLSASTPPFQRFTDAVNASEGWQTQAELGFIAIGDPAFREALLTYNRYGTLPGPPQPGCSPPQAPCSSIAFSMRVNFRENATAARCAVPACSPAQGARLATQFCQSAIFQGPKPNGQDCPGGSANETTHDWLALKSGPGTPHRWRCYSPTVLSANHTAYQGGAESNAFFPAIGMLKAINLPRQSRDKHSALVKLGEKGVFMQVLISVPRPPSSRAL